MSSSHSLSRTPLWAAAATAFLTLFFPCSTAAQAQAKTTGDSGGLLVDFLEDTLSGDSRHITVTGLTGALSSQASIERLTVADDAGIWLTIEQAKLDWNRLALLQGRFSVNTLSAEAVTLLRRPAPVTTDPALPSPEATPFALPELPVALDLKEIRARRVDLGAELLGQPASLSLNGGLSLADGALQTRLEIARLDKPGDRLWLNAGYANQTQQIDLDLSFSEAAGGLIAAALDLPGRPTLELTAKGSGPVSDFAAEISLRSNGQDRLTGQVVLAANGAPAPAGGDAPEQAGIAFSADLGGDIDPLLHPDYRAFFGPGLRLVVRGKTLPEGAAALDTLALNTRALRVAGALAIGSGGGLETANLKATITPPAGVAAILLPLPGAGSTVAGADISLQKTAAGDWTLSGVLQDLVHPAVRLGSAQLAGTGTLGRAATGDAAAILDGSVTASLRGLAPQDAALAAATGDSLDLVTHLTTAGPTAFSLKSLTISGADFRLAGNIAVSGLDSGLTVTADLEARAADLSRFDALAGQRLGGAVQARAAGSATPLSGAFDIDLGLTGQNLSAGVERIDPFMAGETTLHLRAARGPEGLFIDHFDLSGALVSATAKGQLSSTSGQLSATARLHELERLVPEAPGTLEVTADLTRSGDTLSGQARLAGPHSSAARLDGRIARSGDADLTFDAALNELQRFAPELAGALSANGTAQRRDGQWAVKATARAPAEARADLSASYSETSGDINMAASGQLRLEGANPFIKPNLASGAARFDLAMTGAPSLENLSGQLTTSGAVLALPTAGQRINDIAATVSLQNARAELQITARPGDSGSLRISGPVALTAPYQSDIAIALLDLVMSDHLSYDTLLNGRLNLTGPLAGDSRMAGRIDVGETNINLNTAAGSVTAAPIPPITHIGASSAAEATRARAGLIEVEKASAAVRGPSTTLDVVIDAPGRVFARGRGLRAELGGRIRLQGKTDRISPSGQIGLIRGRFDILGRRLLLDEGRITLLGNLTPYLEFRSSAQTEQGSATLEISGLINAPEITVTSEPPRPSEEALALLLFGDNIKDLSPLALARLATSALTLSGRGGTAQESLRESTGADDADFGLDGLGAGRLGLGGYLSENLYTDVDVNTRGESELSLNLDVTRSLTVTGKVDSQGESGLGVFFKRDY